MKKTITGFIITASIVALAYGGWQLYLLYKSPIKIIKVNIKDLTINKINLTVFLELMNWGDVSGNIKEQNYEVFFNNEKVSTINVKDDVHLNSNGPTVFPIDINVETKKLLNNALANILNLAQNRNNITIEVKGYLSLSSGIVNLKRLPVDIKYTLQELIDISKQPKTE